MRQSSLFSPPSTVDTYALRHIVRTKPSEGIYISSLTFFSVLIAVQLGDEEKGKNIQIGLFLPFWRKKMVKVIFCPGQLLYTALTHSLTHSCWMCANY